MDRRGLRAINYNWFYRRDASWLGVKPGCNSHFALYNLFSLHSSNFSRESGTYQESPRISDQLHTGTLIDLILDLYPAVSGSDNSEYTGI